jgi:tetratricopeptide (TPR) repeat protein
VTGLAGYAQLKELLTATGATLEADVSIDALRERLDAALSELPVRWRTIVVRCDLGGELHASVAADLGISKRHLYRERRKALALLAEVLSVGPAPKARTVIVEVDPQLAAAATLSQTDRVERAVPILETALQWARTDAAKIRIFLQLSSVFCQLRQFTRADSALAAARQTFTTMAPERSETAALLLEIATAEAKVLDHHGKTDAAEARLLRGVGHFTTVGIFDDQITARAFAQAQLTLANLMGSHAEQVGAIAYAAEAERVIRRYKLETVLQSRAMSELGALRFFSGVAPSAMVLPDLRAAYALAQANGFVTDVVQSALALAFLYSRAAHHAHALQFARASLQVMQITGMRAAFVSQSYFTLAAVQTAAGDRDGALQTLTRLRASMAKHPWSPFPYGKLVEGQILLQCGSYEAALRVTNDAVTGFAAEGRTKTIGACLRVRAEIQTAIGDRHGAQRTLEEAIELLGAGVPAPQLGAAYALLATLTGKREHRFAAKELSERLRL